MYYCNLSNSDNIQSSCRKIWAFLYRIDLPNRLITVNPGVSVNNIWIGLSNDKINTCLFVPYQIRGRLFLKNRLDYYNDRWRVFSNSINYNGFASTWLGASYEAKPCSSYCNTFKNVPMDRALWYFFPVCLDQIYQHPCRLWLPCYQLSKPEIYW